MMDRKHFLHLLFIFVSVIAQIKAWPVTQDQEVYYWKEYTGTIPQDAVPGGKTKDGNTTYIGQAYHDNALYDLVPGEIDASTKMLSYVEFGEVHMTQKDIKILCARFPGVYQWVDYTKIDDVPLLSQKNFIPGGYYKHLPYLIGRTELQEGRLAVGKVYIRTEDFHDWFSYIDNGAHSEKTNFQVLLLKPSTSDNKGNTVYIMYNIDLSK